MGKPMKKVKARWSNNFAYAIGLIASDGNLSADGRHIYFVSVDLALVENLKNALKIDTEIFKHHRGGEKEKKYYVLSFGDVKFCRFLNDIGIHPAKSKTIKEVAIPSAYFSGFLRGLFDGDGTFYTFWDKRWPNSFGYKISFASASKTFVLWLKEKLTEKFQVKGFIRPGDGVFNLNYVKGDSRKLFSIMYPARLERALFLERKYNKIKLALEQDKKPR